MGGDGDGGDDGIRVQEVAEDKPLPRYRTQPQRPPPVADDGGGDVAAVAVAVVAVDAVVVAVAVAAAGAAVPERCLRILATRRRAPGRFRVAGPPTRAPPRTDCRCYAASGRNPRADSRARNCCARSCVRGASPVPASFQPVAPPALVAVPVVHVLSLLLPSISPTTDGTLYSFILVDDDHDEDEDDSGDKEHERGNEEEARLSHMSRRHRRRERHRRVRSVSVRATDDQRSDSTRQPAAGSRR